MRTSVVVASRLILTMAVVGFALLDATPALAQVGTITGTVQSRVTGDRLVGARVVVIGTQIEARTDVDGAFTIAGVPLGERRVQVFYPGFGSLVVTTNVTAQLGQPIRFELQRLTFEMDEIVVTGTAGQARRREVGNSISQVTPEDISAAPVATVNDVLQGRATGAIIQSNTGQVGAGTVIRLRGGNSITQTNDPLIYVDGIRINEASFGNYADEANNTASPVNDINPEDIDRVEIIKGASATTLYGTEASGGVIQIFTKKGTAGRPIWSFAMDQGTSWLGHVGPSSDINPTGLGLNDCSVGDASIGTDAGDPSCPSRGTFLRNAHEQRYNLSVRGGSETTNYFFSGKWADQQGVIAPQGSEDWAIRGNFGFEPVRNLTIQYNTSYAHREITWLPDGNNAEGFLLNVFRGENGYTPNNEDGLILDMDLNTTVDHFITGVNLTFTGIRNFTHRLNVGIDWARSEYTEERPFGYFRVPLGDRENDTFTSQTLTLDYAGTWNYRIAADVTSAFSFGGQLFDEKTRSINGFGENFAGPGQKDVDSGALTSAAENRVELTSGGFFLQEQLGFKDRLFVTGGVRWDGFSTFGQDFGLTTYPKFQASYLISENEFWPDWFPTMKLRGAVGWSGKAPGVFDAERVWDAVSGDDGLPAVTPANIGDPDLGPERTREVEVGAEGALFNGRVTFEYNYFTQKTTDALVAVQQVPSLGFVSTQLTNVGELNSWGHEGSIDINILPSRTVNWDVGARFSTNASEATDLNDEIIILGVPEQLREGFAFPGLFGERLRNPNEVGGTADRCRIPENRAEFDSDPDACGYYGPQFPTYNYGLWTRFTIGGRLTIDALGEGQGGHYQRADTARQTVRRGAWPTCNIMIGGQTISELVAAGDVSQLTVEQQSRCARVPEIEDWISAATFFRMRNLGVSYRLPNRWLPGSLSNVTLRVAARNLFIITDYADVDPEAVEDGSSTGQLVRRAYYNLPTPRNFVFSLKVDF